MPQAVLPLFVGQNTGQVLEDIEVRFPTPALEVESPNNRVEVNRCEVIPGKVIISGRVVKDIPFKTATSETVLDARRPVRIVCGDIRHCTAFVPFRLFIEIPGAMEGDNCSIVEACVLGEVDTLIDENGDGLFERLIETMNIHVTARVTRDRVVNVSGARVPMTRNVVPFPRPVLM